MVQDAIPPGMIEEAIDGRILRDLKAKLALISLPIPLRHLGYWRITLTSMHEALYQQSEGSNILGGLEQYRLILQKEIQI